MLFPEGACPGGTLEFGPDYIKGHGGFVRNCSLNQIEELIHQSEGLAEGSRRSPGESGGSN
jgi:hypothetical protein